jgi:hypothetical protein
VVYEVWADVVSGTGTWANNYSSYRTTKLPTSFTPQIGPVRNATVNGANLESPPAIANADTPVILSWLPPTGHAPDVYDVAVYILGTSGIGPVAQPDTILVELVTPQTSVTIPAGLLESGNTYYVSIGTLFGAGFSATSPYRRGFPNAYTSIASGLFAVGPTAATAAASAHPAAAGRPGKVRMLHPSWVGQSHSIPQAVQTRIP